MKIIIFLSFYAVVTLAASYETRELCNPDNDHDLTDGCSPNKNDTILFRAHLSVPEALLQVHTYTLEYPENGTISETIHCIRILDIVEDGHGGCPIISSGGSGFKKVSLLFISQRSRQMKFNIEISGS